jgi:RsiW-degrading membrane proteinase PrsW (M82 family)
MADPSALLGAALLALVPSALYLIVLNAIDRYEKEPWTLLIASVALGAIAAPLVAILVLGGLGRGFSLPLAFATGGGPDPVARIVEQVVAGVLLLGLIRFARDELDDALDGLVYGAAIGAGLGAAETFLFVAGGTGLLTGGTIASLLAAGLNQAFYGAVFGAIVGYAQGLRRRSEFWIVVGLGLATAAFLSAFHDTLPYILGRLLGRPDAAAGVATRTIAFLVDLLGIGLLGVAVVVFWRRERRIVETHLAGETTAGLVTEIDLATIGSFRRRLARQRDALRRGGVGELLLLRRLYAAEGELAFYNWHEQSGRRQPAPKAGERLRERIRVLQSDLRRDRDASDETHP